MIKFKDENSQSSQGFKLTLKIMYNIIIYSRGVALKEFSCECIIVGLLDLLSDS